MTRKEMAANKLRKEINQRQHSLDELNKRLMYAFRYESDRQLTIERVIELEGYIAGLEFALGLLEGG